MKVRGSDFVLFGAFILQRSIIYLLTVETRRLVALILECLHSVCKLSLPCWSPVCSPATCCWQGSYAELRWLNVWLIKHYTWINIAGITRGREEGKSSTNWWFDGSRCCFDLGCSLDWIFHPRYFVVVVFLLKCALCSWFSSSLIHRAQSFRVISSVLQKASQPLPSFVWLPALPVNDRGVEMPC